MSSKDLTAAIGIENVRSLAAGSLASELTRWNTLHEQLVPSALRSMMDLNEKFERLVDPFGLKKLGLHNLAGLGIAKEMASPKWAPSNLIGEATLHAKFAGMTRAFDQPEWLKLNQQLAGTIAASASWREISGVAAALGTSVTLTHHLARMNKFDKMLGHSLAPPAHAIWSDHLKALTVPAASFLGHDWARPMAMIAELPDADFGASVSWLMSHRETPLVAIAALLPEAEPLDDDLTVITDGDPICGICGGPMLSLGTTRSWHGPRRGMRHQRLFPACSRCMLRERDEPGFLLEQLAELTNPIRYVIEGGRRGDGISVGELHLVRDDGDWPRPRARE